MLGALSRFIKSLFLLELLKGLTVTGRRLFLPKFTLYYPEEHTPQSPRFRGLHALRLYPNGEERCIACKLCEAACPALCITIESALREDGTRRTTKYDIDMTRIYEFHFEQRGQEVIHKEELLLIGDQNETQIAADRALDARYR